MGLQVMVTSLGAQLSHDSDLASPIQHWNTVQPEETVDESLATHSPSVVNSCQTAAETDDKDHTTTTTTTTTATTTTTTTTTTTLPDVPDVPESHECHNVCDRNTASRAGQAEEHQEQEEEEIQVKLDVE